MEVNDAEPSIPDLADIRLPTRSLTTDAYPVDQQIPVWQAYNAPLVEFTPLDDDTPGLTAAVEIWNSQSLLIVNLRCQRPGGQRYSVTFRPSHEEYLILRFGRSGRMVGRIGDEPMDFLPGDVHLFDIRHPFQALTDGVDQISLYIPYGDIGYDPARDASHLVFRSGNPANLLIQSAIEVIYSQLPQTDPSNVSALMTGICGMLKGILASARPPEGSQAAYDKQRTQSIQRHILENLTDPDLNTETLTRRFAASRATLYRAFEPYGGVARYISDHRLERAKWELMTGNGKRGVVRAIAEKYGFHDTGNFNRAFRRKFNAAPRDLMADVIISHAGNAVDASSLDPTSHDILRLSDLVKS